VLGGIEDDNIGNHKTGYRSAIGNYRKGVLDPEWWRSRH